MQPVILIYRGEPGHLRVDDKLLKPGDVVLTADPELLEDLESRDCFDRQMTATTSTDEEG